jgi:hypothetical protein
MKINLSILILSAFTLVSFGQEKKVENGNLSVEFKKSKKVSNTFNLNSSSKIKSKELKKISIKCKVQSLNKDKVDINKFSLVDHKNKLRYRPTDISFQPVVGYLVFGKLFKKDINYGKMAKFQAGIDYKPEIKDTYMDFSIEGYTDVEIPMTFAVGIGKKEKSIVYFQPNNYNKFQALIFFAIVEKAKNPDLEFYYGDEKIANVKI